MPEPLTLTEGQDFTLTRLASPEVGDTIVPAATFGIMLCSGGEASAHIGSHAHSLCRGSLAVLFPYSLFTFDSRGSDFDGWFVEINVSLLISTIGSLPIADRLAIRQRACVKSMDGWLPSCRSWRDTRCHPPRRRRARACPPCRA